MRIPRPFLINDAVIELVRGGAVERIDAPEADSYLVQLENMAEAVRGDARPLLGRADATGQARTLEGLYRSAERGGAAVSLAAER